jgi:hypothetical protein
MSRFYLPRTLATSLQQPIDYVKWALLQRERGCFTIAHEPDRLGHQLYQILASESMLWPRL